MNVATMHSQRGEIETSHALIVIALLLGVMAWWQLSPQTFPLTKATYRAQQEAEAAARQALEDRVQSGETTTLYKWRDADGAWHFDTKKPNGVEFTAIKGTPNVTELPPLEANSDDAEPTEQ